MLKKMSIVRDFNLNLMQGYASSLTEVLKQTMLSQDVIFRKQVHELHRLYSLQKTLMADSGWKELDGYSLWKESTHSTLGPFKNPMQCSAKETNYSGNPKKYFLEENHNYYSRIQQGTSNPQHPPNQYVHHVGNGLLEKGNGWDLRKCLESKPRFYDDSVSFPEEVKLTLSIGGDTRKEGSCKSTWYDKITDFSSHHVVDLEDSTDTESNEDAKSVSTPSLAVPITGCCEEISRNFVKKDLSRGLTLSYSPDGSESCEGQNSFNQGFKEQRGNACNGMFDKEKPLTSCKVFSLDLNRVQVDDCSSGAFDGVIGNLFEGTCSTNSTIFQQDKAANPTLRVPDSKKGSSEVWPSSATFEGISRTDSCPIDLESKSGPLSETCENINSENMDLMLKYPKGNHTDATKTELIEMGEEVTLSPHRSTNGSTVEDANSNKSHSSCKFDCIADDSSSGGKTMHSGIDFEGTNISPFNQLQKSQSSQVVETQSGEHEMRSSNSSELKGIFQHQIYKKKKEELTEGDVLIQKAAESLILFSLGSLTSNQDCCAKADSKPQYSLDSYESLVLKLPESSADDYCVSSKPYEVNELENTDCGSKLRRGRRLKDFRRDVLPSLASLSRQEIREDVNIMEAVIRSREYKRMRLKMANGGNWFAPVKSRRSRLNYAGRRHYS